MRGVDLDRFDFDYDLTWMGFFLDSEGRELGRYGGRDANSAEGQVSLIGLRHAMRRALQRHRTEKTARAPQSKGRPRVADDLPAARRLPALACIHCHHVYDFRREVLEDAGTWRREALWVYPLPENLGIRLDRDQGDRVVSVATGSSAEKAGLRGGDRLHSAGGRPIDSFASLQYALHRAPAQGRLSLTWERDGKKHTGELTLKPGWRVTDLSWRWSLRGVDPPPWVQGEDLTLEERKKLGLPPERLALRQGPFVSQPARQAGVQPGDVIIGIDGKALTLTARQLGAHVRLNYRVGDRITYNLLRAGRRIDIALVLTGRKMRP